MANYKVVQSHGMLDETCKWGPVASSVNKANVNETQNGNKVLKIFAADEITFGMWSRTMLKLEGGVDPPS